MASTGAGQASAAGPSQTDATAASTTVGEVVIKGHKKPPESYSRAVSGFVASHSQPSPIGTLSRWLSPVCPAVVGLTPRYTELVSTRIKEVAAAMGAPHTGGCRHDNVRVVFTTEPQRLMDYVREKLPDILGYHFLPQEMSLATFHGPIDAWHKTGTQGENGGMHADDPYNQGDPTVASGGAYMDGGSNASRLKGVVASRFLFALVVVDSGKVSKRSIGSVADQIAMLVLTSPKRPKVCSPLPSLQDSLDPACPASASLVTFSPYDEAFLKALYSSDPQEKLALEQGAIARRVEKSASPGAAN